MIKAKYKITGRICAGGDSIPFYPELEDLEISPSAKEQNFKSDKYGFDNVKINAVNFKEHYLEGTNLILVLPDDSKLTVDISSYIDSGLTDEQIEAINNMTFTIDDENLIIEYDESVLDLDFSIDGGNLIIENNVDGVDFNINQNGELEVLY